MLNTIKKHVGLAALLSYTTIALFACGGGASTPPTLNLFAAYKTFAEEGYFLTGVISGYCQGTRAQTFRRGVPGYTSSNPPVPALIQSVSEIDVLATGSSAFCQSFYRNPSFDVYFDPNTFTPMNDGSGLGYVYENQVALPTSVTAGSNGTFFTSKYYKNVNGERVLEFTTVNTWEVKADTATTLLYIVTNTATTLTNQLFYKSITTYRLNANNTLTDLTKNNQAPNLVTGTGDQNIYETYYQ